MKLFEKEFKVRVSKYAFTKTCSKQHYLYKVEYSNSRFFPNWKTLKYFQNNSFIGDKLTGWFPKVGVLNKIKSLAWSFKSMEDIEKWYEAEREKEQEYMDKQLFEI